METGLWLMLIPADPEGHCCTPVREEIYREKGSKMSFDLSLSSKGLRSL